MDLKSAFIAATRTDGTVSIVSVLVIGRGNVLPKGAAWIKRAAGDPSNEPTGWWARDLTDQVIAEEVARGCSDAVHGPALSWRMIDLKDVPTDRTYRNAWVDNGRAVVHDMDKAKEIQRQRLRAQRAPALADLDGQWMRAMGMKDQATADAIESQRQAWRDAPADPRIDSAADVTDLKAMEVAKVAELDTSAQALEVTVAAALTPAAP